MTRWLLTRPEEDSAALAAELAARGGTAVIAPLLEIDYADPEPVDLAGVQALLFTSANGVRGFTRIENRRDLAVLAVGDATAAAARAAGFVRVASAGGDAEDLARLARATLDPAAGALFHAAGKERAGDLQGALAGAGFAVRRAVLYRARAAQVLPPAAIAALQDDNLTGALFFSPRTAEVFARLTSAAGLTGRLRGLTALCLSPAVARRLDETGGRGAWGTIRVAERPTSAALLSLIDDMTSRSPPDRPPPDRSRSA